ncbi:MAG TPA: hypothetical protein VMK12_29410 [Anaeromyxobacteraceae bacterium]|nr:hypothetical protein [Anaeromyxobacteraceae bacterium]
MSDGVEDLNQLIEGMSTQKRTETPNVSAKVRELMPAIDRRLRQGGIRHRDIVELLNTHCDFARPLQLQQFRRLLALHRRGPNGVSAVEVHGGGLAGQERKQGATGGHVISAADLRRVRTMDVDLDELAKHAKERP